MSLPMPPNIQIDIYRTFNAGNPYAVGAPALVNVSGFMQPRVQVGKQGQAMGLKWTHILYLGDTVDIRDGYNSQLNSIASATADTVMAYDSNDPTGTKTAFYVAFVERAAGGTGSAHQRAYLDRCQPNQWPTDAL